MEEQILSESEIKIEEEEINEITEYPESSVKTEPNFPRTTRRLAKRTNPKACEKKAPPNNPVNKTWNEYLENDKSLETYYCNECQFETKWKHYLKKHIKKIHFSEEAQVYHCTKCSFKSKWKFSLTNHMKVHSAPGTLNLYKCTKCNYETKWSNGLLSHMKVHLLPKVKKITIYKCTDCSLECKNKLELSQHKKLQHEQSEAVYKCPLCDFQTKFRHGVNKHVKVHNSTKT